MKLAVTGSRHWADGGTIIRVLDAVLPRPTALIHGGAPGVDQQAALWAHSRGIVTAVVRPVRANVAADYLARNTVIVDLADAVIAFRAEGKSNGTDDTIRKAEAVGKLLRTVVPDPLPTTTREEK